MGDVPPPPRRDTTPSGRRSRFRIVPGCQEALQFLRSFRAPVSRFVADVTPVVVFPLLRLATFFPISLPAPALLVPSSGVAATRSASFLTAVVAWVSSFAVGAPVLLPLL